MATKRACVLVALVLAAAGCSSDDDRGASTGGAAGTAGSSGAAGGGSGGTAGAAGSAGSAGSGGGLSELSDTFDGAALDAEWTVFNPDVFDASVSDGALSLSMTTSALWFQSGRGALVYKSVSGDFKISATVHARKKSDPTAIPDVTVQLGGLMARDPNGTDTGGDENYVFIVVGRDENDTSVETKSTTNSVSDYEGPTWPSGDAELRLCRVGSTFSFYKRAVGATTWELAKSYERPDLPATLQVGPNAYTAISPDLVISFDEVAFGDVTGVASCDTD